MATKPLKSIKFPGLPDTYTVPQVDATLTTSGAAADAKIVGDDLAGLNERLEQVEAGGAGLSGEAKQALLQLLEKVAYIDENGQDYYNALYTALYETTWAITNTLANCTTSNQRQDITKNAPYSAIISASVGYTLTGATVSITMGGVDITSTAYNNGVISIPSVTGPLVITISAVALTLSSISAVYTQSGAIYADTTLDDLKDDLVVTAHWNDSSTSIVPSTSYSLSGTLASGTSTITVTYSGKTTTFTVTVSTPLYPLENGSTSFSNDWSVVVSEGKKVVAEYTTANNPGCFANVSKVSLNSNTSTSDSNFINSGTPWFSLLQGDVFTSVITITDIVCASNETDAGTSLGLKAPDKTNIVNLTVAGTKVINLTVGDTIEATYTAESNIDVGCLGFWCGNRLRKTPIKVGFTLEAYINGVRIV